MYKHSNIVAAGAATICSICVYIYSVCTPPHTVDNATVDCHFDFENTNYLHRYGPYVK